MNLKIIGTADNGDTVFWKLDGDDGRCDIVNGLVFSTYLCGGPFDMRPCIMSEVADQVQSAVNSGNFFDICDS